MSKFIDKLKQLSQTAPQPVGFRTALIPVLKPKMLLIASLTEIGVDDLAGHIAGADAGLLSVSGLSSGAKNLGKASQDVPAIPWGGWLKRAGRGDINTLLKAGCDFLVFPEADTPLSISPIDKAGGVLAVDTSLGEGFLRAVNELPVDAVLVSDEKKESLIWHDLVLYQRFAGLLSKPLLISVPREVTAGELQMLWDVGVGGVIVEVDVSKPAGKIKEIQRKIDKLTLPSSDKRGRTGVLLPHIDLEKSKPADIEEEEEE